MVMASVVRAVELWVSVFPYTVAGILLASTAVEFGIFYRVFPVLKPVMHRTHFTPHSGVAFMTSFSSPVTAVAMLSEFHNFVFISPTIVPVLEQWASHTYLICTERYAGGGAHVYRGQGISFRGRLRICCRD